MRIPWGGVPAAEGPPDDPSRALPRTLDREWERMKVGLVLPGFSTSEGDWGIPALLALARDLATRHDVWVFPLRYPHTTHPYAVHRATVHPIGGGEARGLARLPLLWRAVSAVARAHRGQPFDVLHAFWSDEPGFVAVAAGRLLGIPTVVSLAGGELVHLPDIGYGGHASRLNRWLTRIALRGATHVTAGSSTLVQLAARHAPGRKVRLLPLGVDTARFAPAAAPRRSGGLRLLHAGSLVPVKAQRTLLRAYAQLARSFPDLHLDIAGDGPLRADLEVLATSLALADRVTFHGAVPHDRLPDLYRAADLLVVSSRYEAQGLVALEAAACGLPVVGTRVGILPDLGPAARTIPTGDPAALAAALAEVLADSAGRDAMRQAGLAAVESHYTLEHTVTALERLYRSATTGSCPAPSRR